jgi:hypothetical protein
MEEEENALIYDWISARTSRNSDFIVNAYFSVKAYLEEIEKKGLEASNHFREVSEKIEEDIEKSLGRDVLDQLINACYQKFKETRDFHFLDQEESYGR